jgi:non-specific serine/threonine protein kinase
LSHAYAYGQRELSERSADATPFVGRTTELIQLTGLLSHVRLVTVTGAGGVGKTRLALRAAERVAPRFPDGVCVVELSSLSDPELLPHTVAGRLGLPGQDARSAMDLVLDYLRDRKMLLVLDTCEHLIDACAELAEAVLDETFGITLLATSRQPLDVDGENACPLSPLRVPGSGDVLSPGDATDLFARRAAAATGDFAITMDNRRDVLTVCERLDGIPLAIELAAVRLRTLPLATLAGLLASRLPARADRRRALTDRRLTVTDGQAAVPGRMPAVPGQRGAAAGRLSLIGDASRTEARHRTLRAAIGWSYDLCTPAEQALWNRLSVFAGSFDPDAAAEVCAGRNLPRDRVAETIFSLVDKSVLIRDDDADGGSRYRFLDTIREFGAEQLAASGAETGVRDRLIARYLAKARYFGDHFLDDDQLERFRELDREHANVRAALEHTLESEQCARVRDGAEMATALYGYWVASGRLREGDYWLGKVAEKFPGETPQRAGALVVSSYLTAFWGDIDTAVAQAREGIEIAGKLGEEQFRARGYLYLNLALTFGGRAAEAAEAGAQAERLLQALGDRIGLLCLDAQMAHLYQFNGNFQAAAERYGQGLRRFGETRERWLTSYLYTIASMAMFQQPGMEAECAAAAARALLTKHELGDIHGIGYALEVFVWLAARADRYERSAWLLGAADSLWEGAVGPLGNAATLEKFHQLAVRAAREALGERRFDMIYAQGARYPRDGIVKLAVADADSLPPVIPAPR